LAAMSKKMSDATMLKKMRQIMDLVSREIMDNSIFAWGKSFEDLAMTESDILKLRRGVEKILRSKFSDDEWERMESPLEVIGLADRKIRGPRR
jgi:ABC-type uncharacterized transport system ATPase subunit